MPGPIDLIVQKGSELVVGYAGEWVKGRIVDARTRDLLPPPGASGALASPPGDLAEGGCPACDVCKAVDSAHGRLRGLTVMAAPDGSIPPASRPLIDGVRQDAEAARAPLATVRTQAPQLAPRCDTVETCLQELLASLPSRDTVSLEHVRTAVVIAERAHTEAYLLGREYYDRDARGTSAARVRAVYERDAGVGAKPWDEFYRDLREALDGG